MFTICILGYGVGAVAGFLLLPVTSFGPFVLVMAALWLFLAIGGLWGLAPRVRRAVQLVQHEWCLACGYDLRGMSSAGRLCSECGVPQRCHGCGHSMQGLADARHCPECGEEQDWVPPPPNLRWLVCQYWDAQLPVRREQRRGARRAALQAASGTRHLVMLAGMVVCTVGLVLGTFHVLASPDSARAINQSGWFDVVFSIPLWVVGLVAVWWIMLTLMARATYAPAVRRALADLGYEVCPGCGHWIRGREATFRRCVECGRERHRTPDPNDVDAGR